MANKSHRQRNANKEARALAAQAATATLPQLTLGSNPNLSPDEARRHQEREEYEQLKTRTRQVYSAGGKGVFTSEAWQKYTKDAPGRRPFMFYLPLGFCIQLADIFGELGIPELNILVREETDQLGLICNRSVTAYKATLLEQENVRRSGAGEPLLELKRDLSKIVLTAEQKKFVLDHFRFTGVATVSSFAKWDQRMSFLSRLEQLKRSDQDIDLVAGLAKTKTWLIVGNFFRRNDGHEMAVSGSLWWFDSTTGSSFFDKRSPLYKVYSRSPEGFKPWAKTQREDVIRPFISRRQAEKQSERLIDGKVDDILWSGETDGVLNLNEFMEADEADVAHEEGK